MKYLRLIKLQLEIKLIKLHKYILNGYNIKTKIYL